jgi:hypothetical protein
LKIKLKVRRFDTVEVIEAELEAALNSLTEHDFRCKNCRNAENSAYTRKGTTSRVMVARWQHQSQKLWMAHAHNYPKLTHDVVLPSLPQGSI